MQAVWKFKIDSRLMRIQMPKGTVVLTAQMQGDDIAMWAICNPTEHTFENRIFRLFDTGEVLPDHAMSFIATLQIGQIVHHMFELV